MVYVEAVVGYTVTGLWCCRNRLLDLISYLMCSNIIGDRVLIVVLVLLSEFSLIVLVSVMLMMDVTMLL